MKQFHTWQSSTFRERLLWTFNPYSTIRLQTCVRRPLLRRDDHLRWSFFLWDWVGSEVDDEANSTPECSGTVGAGQLIFDLCRRVGASGLPGCTSGLGSLDSLLLPCGLHCGVLTDHRQMSSMRMNIEKWEEARQRFQLPGFPRSHWKESESPMHCAILSF